jgi:hypothetical protein
MDFKEMVEQFLSSEIQQIRKDLALIEKKLDLPAGTAELKLNFIPQDPAKRLTIEISSLSTIAKRAEQEASRAFEDLSQGVPN